jgi:competence protein ComEA
MHPIDSQIIERIADHSHSKSVLRKFTSFTQLPGLSGVQVALSGVQKKALVVIAVLALATSALFLFATQARPSADLIPVASESSESAVESSAQLVIDVQGEVAKPGLYQLPLGSRVGDAIKAAGGIRKGVSSASVNLARFLEDGEQLYVSEEVQGFTVGDTASSITSNGAGGKLNLNRATASELDGLPGVGPVLAKRIIEYRLAHGNFTKVDELRKVSGIGPAKFGELQSFVTV